MYTHDVIKNGIVVARLSFNEEPSQLDINKAEAPYLQEPKVFTQAEKDFERYSKRAIAKNEIITEIATENMQRIRTGVWTISDIISLVQDEDIKEVLSNLHSLSFELAATKLASVANPLITSEIKAIWIQKLQTHFYL